MDQILNQLTIQQLKRIHTIPTKVSKWNQQPNLLEEKLLVSRRGATRFSNIYLKKYSKVFCLLKCVTSFCETEIGKNKISLKPTTRNTS